MVMKLIASGATWEECLTRTKGSLDLLVLDGVETNRAMLVEILTAPDFVPAIPRPALRSRSRCLKQCVVCRQRSMHIN